MALYRIGTAAMDAQGVITGTGTKWREPLSLIRTGATIVFLDQPVIKLAVISEIVSNTEMKAISTDGAVVPDGKYVILINDSLTVDGMAQDVAETLRYYQSKETVIEEAIEFFKNFDLKTLQDLVNKVNADAQQVASDKAATEQLKNEAQQIKDSAVSETQQIKDAAVNETNQIKADTDAIKTQTQQIKDSAIAETGTIKNEAVNARDAAKESQLAAEQSNVAAGNAKQGAETARDEARQWAQQVNPENLLHKDQNLNDVANKDLAREALKVEAVNSVKGQNPGDYNSFRNPAWTYELRISNNGEWRVARNDNNNTSALSVGAGGTGAENVNQAKINLQVDKVIQLADQSNLASGNGNIKLYVKDNGEWGAWDSASAQAIALLIERGGTGATTVDGARHNLGLAKNHSPIFAGIDLQGLNGTTSGIAVLRNRNADGVQISYSRIYNEITVGTAKTVIQTTREGGDTTYYVFDEAGNAKNFNSLAVGRRIADNVLGPDSIAIGDSDTGIKSVGDGAMQFMCNGRATIGLNSATAFIYNSMEVHPVAGNNANGIRIAGAREGGGNSMLGGQVAGGAFTAWRDRAAGLLVEVPGADVAVNIAKAVQWGADWIFGLDVARYGNGGCEMHLNVRGTSYTFNDAGYASAVQWVNTSDIRLKANLKEIKSAKDKVKSIKGYTYFKRNSLEEDENSFYSEEAGVIAQDVQTVLPEAVYKISDSEILGVSYGGVTALLVNAINEMIDDSDKQNETIQKQQDEINELKNEVAEMKKMIEEMQSMFIQIAK